MTSPASAPSHSQQTIINRFVTVCQADQRVVAAFLGGSYARDAADTYSDLDLYLVTTEEAFDDFYAEREAFMHLLGEPLFLEDFDLPNIIFYVFSNGVEGELGLGRQSQFQHIHSGPYKVLLDKKGILAGAVFPRHQPAADEQIEILRRLIYWFWHDVSHFLTAMGRGQLWWAHGQLEGLRLICVNLARLRADFSAGADGYEKVEKALPVAQLSPLQTTYCPLENEAMLRAGLTIVHYYRELAPVLARTHGILYPEELEQVVYGRLAQLCQAYHVGLT